MAFGRLCEVYAAMQQKCRDGVALGDERWPSSDQA
jgi:hypothetical protein